MTHVLVITTSVDAASDVVVAELNSLGARVVRVNTEELPFNSAMSLDYSTGNFPLLQFSGTLDSTAPLAVWYRRVRAPACPPGMEDGVYEFCVRETKAAIVGSLLAQDARFMSRPAAIWAAEHKGYQLAVASRIGLTIPDTRITNDPSVIRRAFDTFDRQMIIKPARTGFVDCGSEQRAIYTSQVLAEHLDKLESEVLTPSIYQVLIPKECDLRVTVVGSQVFAARIDSQSDPAARVDWRMTENPDLAHERHVLPDHVKHHVLHLMRQLGLEFGAIDFVITPHGEYVFLEVNPNGQWLWLDDLLDLGISRAVAEWLVGET